MNDARPRFSTAKIAQRLLLVGGLLAAAGLLAASCGQDSPSEPDTNDGAESSEGEVLGGGMAMGEPDSGLNIPTDFKESLKQTGMLDNSTSLGRPVASGRPVDPGVAVPVVLGYRKGAEARHRITIHTKSTRRNDGQVSARRVIYYTKSKVTSGDGTGAARIRFELTRMRYAFPVGEGGVIEIDSAEITDAIQKLFNDNPSIALAIKPDMATIGKPAEFKIGATGRIESVEGVEGWRRAFIDALTEVDARAVADAAHAPTAELLIDMWGLYLFPPLGGRKLNGGATREVRLRENTFQKAYVAHPVRASVTHVSDTGFTVQGVSTAKGEPQTGRALTPSQEAIFRTRIVASNDTGDHHWEVERESGFLNRAFHKANFQIWVAYSSGANPKQQMQGATNPDAVFTIVERIVSVEREDQPAARKDEPETGKQTPNTDEARREDETAAAPAAGTGTEGEGEDSRDD